MDLEIRGKKAIVAGASAGMGKSSALALAHEGVDLYISARGEQRLVAAAKEISDLTGANVVPVIADHSKEDGRQTLIDACPEPDIMVTTISPPPIRFNYKELTPEDWHDSIDLGLVGPIEMMKYYTEGMAQRGWGRIVNIGTVAAKMPLEMRLLSGPARSALINYTAVVSRLLAKNGVIINNVLPGMIETPGMYTAAKQWAGEKSLSDDEMGLNDRQKLLDRVVDTFSIPTGTVGNSDDVGKMVAMFCGESAKFTVGQSLIVDGGMAPLM